MILICGAGTLGANLAEQLGRRGGHALAVLDFDRVEAHNLANQPYATQQVGQPKVVALSESLYRFGADLKPLQARLERHNARRFLRDATLVVDAFDNSAARAALQAACRELNLPLLHLGISRNGYGEVVWDEFYQVPADGPEDPCARATSRALALLVTAMADRALRLYFQEGARHGFCVTEDDLAVHPLL